MRNVIPLTTALLLAGSTAQAQAPHFGFALNLAIPTGEFRSKTYPANPDVLTPQTEGYDIGLGGQFTLSFPVDQGVAIRLNFGGQVTNGSNTAPGYEKLDLQHNIFSIGGEFQFFVNGSALRHRGTYFLMGPSADFERFDVGRQGDYDFHADYSERKSRLGATFGIGHTFTGPASRFTFEAAYHKTLSGNDVAKGEPPSADFVKVSFGWVF